MTKNQKYLEVLKTFSDYVTISEWAEKVSEIYPDLLKAAETQAKNQKQDTTGLREIAARISSAVSTNIFNNIQIDTSQKPRKVNRGKVPLNMGYLSGTPETIRTSDPRLRRPLLYPAELRAHTLKLAFSVWRARLNSIIEMVGVEGFEPPTTWSQTRYATRLRYTPKQEKNYTIKE